MPRTPKDHLLRLLLTHSVLRGRFTLASGLVTDTYVDVRRTALRGDGACAIGSLLYDRVHQLDPEAKGVGGLALGAVPLLTAITYQAALTGSPDFASVIVRKTPKDHGTSSGIEQPAPPSTDHNHPTRLVAVDDVITTAGSTLKAIQRLREEGYVITHAVSVIDREAGGREALEAEGVQLFALFTLNEILQAAAAGDQKKESE